MSFTKDAFGKPRNGDWSDMGGLFQAKLDFADVDASGNPVGTIDITKRGFTDHEHLDEMQLIHMNGRVYDYNNGRFLSVDPFIQSPTSTQSMNPYTYIFNNPLSGVDSSGYKSEIDKFGTKNVAPTGSHIKSGKRLTGKNSKGGTAFIEVHNGKVTSAGGFGTLNVTSTNSSGTSEINSNGKIKFEPSEGNRYAQNDNCKYQSNLPSCGGNYYGRAAESASDSMETGGEILEEMNPLSAENLFFGAVFKSLKLGRRLLKIHIPGSVKSRINLMNGSVEDGIGFKHVIARHFDQSINASQFTISQTELKKLIQSRTVVDTPITRVLESKDGLRFLREVKTDKVIGLDKFRSFQDTKTMTVLTDESGNLITATPGKITSPGINIVE